MMTLKSNHSLYTHARNIAKIACDAGRLDTSRSARAILRKILVVLGTACFFASSAYAAPTSIEVSVDSTGGNVGPLNSVGDDLCPTASTNGCDFSASDNIVRTHDGIMYDFALQVDPPGDKVYLEAVLKPGMVWDELHGLCNFSTSSITGDGTAASPSKIHCDLGQRSAWATNLQLMARVLGDNPNGATVGLASAQFAGDATAPNIANLSAVRDAAVTAKPRLNAWQRVYSDNPYTHNGVAGARIWYMVFIDLWDNDRNGNPADDPKPLLGNELVTGPVTFDLDLSGVSPGAILYQCGPSTVGYFPYDTYNSSFPHRSLNDAGTRSCTTGGGTNRFTISGADLSFDHVPTETRTGSAIPGDRSYGSTLFYRVFIPLEDINANGGELPVDTQITNLTATSISGQANLPEDISDNATGVNLIERPGSFHHTYRCYRPGTSRPSWCGGEWWSGPTDSTSIWAGNGSTQPEQTWAAFTYYVNRSFSPDNFADICGVYDTRYYEVDTSNGRPIYVPTSGGAEGVDYIAEYGTGYVSTTWRDAATVPANAIPDECNAPAANWYSSYAAAQAAGPITKIRLRRLTPLPAGAEFAFAAGLKAKSNADLASVPAGTLFKSWGTFRAETTIANYRSCSYVSGTHPSPSHSTNSCGDRLYLNRSLSRIGKITVPDDLVNVVSAGGVLTYELSPSHTSLSGAGSDNIVIVDQLPAGTTYNSGSATQNGTLFAPTVTGTPATGQTLTWDLGNVRENTPIAPIRYSLTTALNSTNGTVLTNTAEIRPSLDISEAARRSASRNVTMSVPVSLLLGKTVDKAMMGQNEALSFNVEYFNSTPQSISNISVIDVLPYNGDGRLPASNFSGSLDLVSVTTQSGNGTFYFSKDAPNTITSDPAASANNLSSGTTNWCPATAGNGVNPSAVPSAGGSAAQCPANLGEVTAVRLEDNQPLAVGQSRRLGINVQTGQNFGGDIYSNQAQASAQGVSLSPRSPFATSEVTESLELAIAKADPANADDDGSGDVSVGDVLTYTVTATNNSNRPLTNVEVNDPKITPSTTTCASVAIGASCVLTGTYTVTLADAAAGNINNTATATSRETTDPVTTPEVVTPVPQKPSLAITKTDPANADDDGSGDVSVGDVLTYTVTATNDGNIALSGVEVNDPKITPSSEACDTLAVGDSCVLTGTYTVTLADAEAGSINNTATATSTETTDPVTTPEVVTPVPQKPSMALVKGAPSHADNDGSGDVSLGDVLTYTITATNDGNITLNNVVVSDTKITPSSNSCATVPVGAACVLTGTYTVTQADVDAGNVTNNASVTSNEITDPTTTPDVVTPVAQKPSIALVKAEPANADNDGSGDVSVNDVLTYTITATNNGNVTLSDVLVSDAKITPSSTTCATLAVGDACVLTGTYTVVQADVVAGEVVNSAAVNPGELPEETTDPVVTMVPALVITATDDITPAVNSASGSANAGNAYDNDTLNGNPVDPADIIGSITTPATPLTPGAPVPTMDPATGVITIPAGTPAGSYEIEYQICENINPTNCTTATVTIPVDVTPIHAVDDTPPAVNGADGSANAGNAYDNDTLNGDPVDLADITGTITTPATPLTLGAPVPSIDPATGIISVPPGTPAGTYEISYQICENINPDNCTNAVTTVTVEAAPIEVTDDTPPAVNGADGAPNAGNAYDNDTLNGNPVELADITGAITTPATPLTPGAPVPAIDPATGVISVPPGTPAGSYEIAYQICENLNPTNCATGTAMVTVDAPPIEAGEDNPPAVNGADGSPNAGNVFDNDTLNGDPVDPADITSTIIAPAIPLTPDTPVPAIDPATGVISVPRGTPAGTYEITYQICENLNPTNCATATTTVTVDAPVIEAGEDTPPAINGADGSANAGNVFDNDTLNGQPVDPADITGSITSPATPLTPGAPVPSIDPATGIISVPPGTPAGTYEITYQICENLNPTNCATATTIVTVEAAPIETSPDNIGPIDSTDGSTNAGNVYDNDTLNGQPVDPADIIGTIVEPAQPVEPGASVPAIDLATGIISVPPGTPAGDYEITYQICERLNPDNCSTSTVTVSVSPPVAGISGIVFIDENGDGIYQEGEELLKNWIIEIAGPDGHVMKTVRTDENGHYLADGLPLGECIVSFRNPNNNVLYGTIEEVNLAGGNIIVDQNLPIDPSGVVYDSVTRQPIADTRVTLVGANGDVLPEVCFLDPTQQNQLTDASGMYRFDIVPGSAPACPVGETEYRIIFDAPGNYSDNPSTVIAPQADALSPPVGAGSYAVVANAHAPTAGDDTTYYLTFLLDQGDRDVIHNHIALDPFQDRSPLVIQKTSIKRTASVGDLIPYTITVRNNDNVQRSGVTVIDIVPAGFKYVPDSALVNGVASEPTQNGRELSWSNQTINANSSATYDLTLVVGAGVTGGDRVNTGLARNGFDNEEISNRGQAVITIVASALFDCSEIIGKVFDDVDGDGYQDDGEPGIAGVRLANVNGELITTDAQGRYHITCAAVPDARIGSNYVLKLDTRTLPKGYSVTSENPRAVRLTRGKITKLNFGAKQASTVRISVDSAAFIAGRNDLRPEFAGQLQQLIGKVDPDMPRISIVYRATPAENAEIAKERVMLLKNAISELFAIDWNGPKPSIKTEVNRMRSNKGGE